MKATLSALIVDDEEKAVALLKKLLEDTQEFSEIQSAFSASGASSVLRNFQPDLIFLDIKMPGKDGFTLLRELKPQKKSFEVVFVTAYDQFALQAIKNSAFDYLLKPVDRKELRDCIAKYKNSAREPDFLGRLEKFIAEQKEVTKLRINTRTGYIFVDPASVLYCKADGNYTYFDLGDRQHLCSMQLGVVEGMLPGNGFIRLGRSLIVNLTYIIKVDRKTKLVTFEKDSKVYSLSISKSQLKELEVRQG